MAATDTTTLMLQMPQEIYEQHRSDMQKSEARMLRMIQELRLGQAPAAAHTFMDSFPALKIDFKELSGELED